MCHWAHSAICVCHLWSLRFFPKTSVSVLHSEHNQGYPHTSHSGLHASTPKLMLGRPLSLQSLLKKRHLNTLTHIHTLKSDMPLLVFRPLPALHPFLSAQASKINPVSSSLSASTHSPPLIHTALQIVYHSSQLRPSSGEMFSIFQMLYINPQNPARLCTCWSFSNEPVV